jgi:hypothetical protein
MSFRMVHENAFKSLKCQIGVLLDYLENTKRGDPNCNINGTSKRANEAVEGTSVLKPRVKAANVPKWAQSCQESIWESGEVGDIYRWGRKASDEM